MNIQKKITNHIIEAVKQQFDLTIDFVEFQTTRKDFEGDVTFVVFPLVKLLRKSPADIGQAIGEYLVEHVSEVEKFNVIQGFVNLVISEQFYLKALSEIRKDSDFGKVSHSDSDAMLVEFASPNTNKPLHLGHIRNILLGHSVSKILQASGKKVYNTQIVNDRGIHICKSMVAWQKFGEGEIPSETLKGDKLVGNYYVKFDKEYKQQVKELVTKGFTEDEAKKQAPIFIEAQEMLKKWEQGDADTVALWEKMNAWVYAGFDVTFDKLGVTFDKNYYESNTYLLGKDIVDEGLSKNIFFKKEDGSVWIDLTDDGLDEKLVLRSDGTSVYMTQDLGTAVQRVKDFENISGMVYTVGNEQDYHFKVLFLILKKMGYKWADNLFHLSYGMVDLPSGKMKSREGTVVDADDLIDEMVQTAQEISEELGKIDGYSENEKSSIYQTIGMGALKYFILKVDPKKRIVFNPKESIDFNGNTGPFIQYTYARIQSILRKADFDYTDDVINIELETKEKELIKVVLNYPNAIQNAAKLFSPAIIANYVYDLVKEYNSFYQSVYILGEQDVDKKIFRVQLSGLVANIIQSAFDLLGVDVPERM